MPPTSTPSEPAAEAASRPRGIRSLLRRQAAGTLAAKLTHDYSTEKSKPVPVTARVPRWHLTALWITLLGGIPALTVGVAFYQSGYSFARALAAMTIGGFCYLAYAIPAAYLGARTGRGTALLSRAVFGSAASAAISDLLIAAGAARLAFVSTVAASLYSGLFGWQHVALIAAALAVVAAAVNVFGFVAIAAVARYLTAPLLLAWAGYLVIRGVLAPHLALGAPEGARTLPFQAGIGVAISVVAWGNEPDSWRYGKAEPRWSVAPYLGSLAAGGLLFAAAGWLMASLSRGGAQAAFPFGVRFSTFGVVGLTAVVITMLQIASSSGACYQMTNAVQNFVGQLRGWQRWHTAAFVAALGGLTTWAIHGSVTGFARVAAWSALVLPSVTVVMCVELLARRGQSGADRSRRLKIPPWGRGARGPNYAAISAVLVAAGYGAWGMALLPGQHAAPPLGFVPAESWLLAAGLYAAIVAARASYAAALSAVGRVRSAAGEAKAKRAEAKRQAAASRAEAKRQAAVSRVEAKRQAAASRVEAKRQAAARRVEAKRLAAARRVEARRQARAGRARSKRRPAQPSKRSPKPVPPQRPRPRDYLEAIRRDLGNEAAANPYLELVSAGALPRDRLGDFATEQAQVLASDRRSFLYLAARSNDPAGALFAEFADAERRALDLLTIFIQALGRRVEPGAGPQRAGCRASPAFVAWLALNAQPVDAALAVVACRPAWTASLAGIGRALRDRPGYKFNERACAFFDLMAAPDAHTEEQLMRMVSASVDTGQPPLRAADYARLLASYQAMFWTTLAAEAQDAAVTAGS
jgi:purine-cytosine permease-like protein